MVIWLYAIFSNEARLLPYFLRHYAPQVDRLILFDNASTDNSRALIAAYHNVEVHNYAVRPVIDSISAAQFASERYHEARGKADLVLWVDCDEFLYSSGETLREALRRVQAQGIRAVRSCGYQMLSESFPASDAPLTEQIRFGIRDTEYDKVAVFDPALNIRFRPGRHNCRIDGATAQQTSIKLLHYRYLGAEYFTRRNAYNFANLSDLERQAGRSYHVAANHEGKYSLRWFQHAQIYATDVIAHNLVEVQ